MTSAPEPTSSATATSSPGATGEPTATAGSASQSPDASPSTSTFPSPGGSSTPGTSPSPGSPSIPGTSASPGASPPAGDAFDPTALTVRLDPAVQDLSSPVFVTGTADGSGRLLVVEQTGKIRLAASGSRLTTFLDLTDRVLYGGERGLLGLALHPDFTSNGRLFVDYTRQPDGATVISEFQAHGDKADPASERVLLTIDQPYPNHNGGMVAFDSEGMLLIGMGDGGSGGDPQGNGQNRGVMLGKLLRIDVDGAQPYAIPADDPFVGDNNTLPEIWDMGMRNPWRFSFDRDTGDLWIGDVGQGTWEEIDAEPALAGGRNYGWNTMEGPVCYREPGCSQDGLTLPVSAYTHDAATCAVTGGYVYRGTAFPEFQGGYFFADYCSGTIWALNAAQALAKGSAPRDELIDTDAGISAFGEGDDGELYVVDLGGYVYHLVPEGQVR